MVVSPARSARSLRSLARPCAMRSPRSARSLRSLARPCATRLNRPRPAPHSLCSGGGAGPRGSPVATRRPRPAASLCPVGACSCAPPRCGSPLGGRCPCGACGSRLGLPPFPAGTLGRAWAGACGPLPRPPPLLGAPRPLSPSLSAVGVRIRPALQPPPPPPTPSHTPRGFSIGWALFCRLPLTPPHRSDTMSLAAFSACTGQQVCGRAPSLRSCAGPRLPAPAGCVFPFGRAYVLGVTPCGMMRAPCRVWFPCYALENAHSDTISLVVSSAFSPLPLVGGASSLLHRDGGLRPRPPL